ncbi:DUF806 family protein [Streptococcus sciuri]|uniref:DUF806 family protein n=1 Tax=Streptococcus sciuri TaxID=2973939 RepID=A0ABT2F7E2_9STRE|nr:DUF806 family protein [Streptococcus sciuri]MCS4488378.1 DUF806 family protein [Streptococcus sciuri]
MLATIEVKNLIEEGDFPEIDAIYTVNLPHEMQENTDKTLVLITEVDTSLDLVGNDTFFGLRNQVEIQLFYRFDLPDDFDMEGFELRLYRYLKEKHWAITDIREHTLDPDTLQVTAVFYVACEKII